MPLPERLVVVAGTGTEVGKTWVATGLLTRWRGAGLRVGARKPLQSFDPAAGEQTDAALLAAVTGEDPDLVCAHSYPLAMAPPMAAMALDEAPVPVAAVAELVTWPEPLDVGLVESAGGVASPLAPDGDTTDLVRLLGPEAVVLVGHAELGALNAIRLGVRALRAAGFDGAVEVFVNGYDEAVELHRRNVGWLRDVDGYRVHTDVARLASALVPSG